MRDRLTKVQCSRCVSYKTDRDSENTVEVHRLFVFVFIFQARDGTQPLMGCF
jgi:hypothetical protein